MGLDDTTGLWFGLPVSDRRRKSTVVEMFQLPPPTSVIHAPPVNL